MGIKTWIILFLIVCPSFLDDLPVGWLSSAGFEYTNGKWIGLGLLRNPAGFWTGCLEGCQFELESAGKTHRCKLV